MKFKIPQTVQDHNIPIQSWHELNALGYITNEMLLIQKIGIDQYLGKLINTSGEDSIWIWENIILELDLRSTSGISMLEVGCGRGNKAVWFSHRGIRHYVGVDCSLACIAFCEHLKCGYRHNNLVFKQMYAEELKFEKKSFDMVYSQHVLEHTHSLEQAIREQFRVGKYVAGIVPLPYDEETSEHLHKITFTGLENLIRTYTIDYQIRFFKSTNTHAFIAKSEA